MDPRHEGPAQGDPGPTAELERLLQLQPGGGHRLVAIRTFWRADRKRISLYVFGDEFTGDSIDRVLREGGPGLNRPDESGERKVRIHAIGFPTIFTQARYGENTGVRFATLMRLLCERNGGAFVALNSLTP